jgi:hypothetical protein
MMLYLCPYNFRNNQMAATANNTAKEKINWQFPEENQTVTVEDFRDMVREAENQPAYSYQEHRKIIDE